MGLTVFKRECLTVIDGIYDFLDHHDDYSANYDEIAADDLAKRITPDDVKAVLLNCCEVAYRSAHTLVDVGSAYGFIVSAMQATRRIAVDIALDYLKQIDSNITRVRANAEDLPLEDGIADCVVCTDVFEHVKDEQALAKSVSRILKPGGQLLFAAPWRQDLSVYETPEYKSRFKQYRYVHLRSVDDEMVLKAFPQFDLVSASTITIGMRHMQLKPYPLRFMNMRKRSNAF